MRAIHKSELFPAERQRSANKRSTRGKSVKKEYDFSKGQRGLFHKPNAVLNVPVYLDKENRDFVAKLAESRHVDVSTLVNTLVRSHIPTSPRATR